MRIKKHIVTVVAFCITIFATMPADLFGTQGSIMFPIGWSMEAVSPIKVGVPIRYAFIVKQEEEHNRPATGATVTVNVIGGLQFEGKRNLEISFVDKLADTFVFEVVLPANDTSGFIIEIQGIGKRPVNLYAIRTYVTTGDSVEVFGDDVRLHPPKSKPRNYGTPLTEEEIRISRARFPREAQQESRYIGGFVPGDTTVIWVRNDSGWYESVNRAEFRKKRRNDVLKAKEREKTGMTKLERDIAKKKEKEKTPLTEYDSEHIYVGDELWYRDRGEFKFKKAVPSPGPPTTGNIRTLSQSISGYGMDPNVVYDLIIDLRDSVDFKFVSSIVEPLRRTDSVGYYRATIKRSVVKNLRERKIRYSHFPRYPSKSGRR